MQFYQMYKWSFEAIPTEDKLTFRATARLRDGFEAPKDIKNDVDYEDFVWLCHEWQICIETFHDMLKDRNLQLEHKVGEINMNIGEGETILFEDVFIFTKGTRMHSVGNLLQPLLVPLYEAVAHLNRAPAALAS